LIIDGIEYDQKAVEARDQVSMTLQGQAGNSTLDWPDMPIRLVLTAMRVPVPPPWLSLPLFLEVGGILGASGPTLSCRTKTVWSSLLERAGAKRFAFDLDPPPNATIQGSGGSRIVLSDFESKYEADLIWSQPKQTGDLTNDGMHEFLMYHLSACGVDLLYNTSSAWLTVIDTSGPCLTLPGFLFDRLRSHVPMDCPFPQGGKAWGRFCSPRRGGAETLPALSFQLEDVSDTPAPKLHLPLERLVYRNGSGHELLCLARDDGDSRRAPADMMYWHIAFGSLAMSSFYAVVDLERHTIGLAPKGNVPKESSDATCASPPTCRGMQEFYPPLNLCEDPDCSQYMFMSLDEGTKVCRWMSTVPAGFGVILVGLAILDLLSHRLYKQTVERASESCQ